MLKMTTEFLSGLHDAQLIGISYLADASIRLDFVTSEMRQRRVLLTGVIHFFCSGMLEGNIVESVEAIDADSVSSEDLSHFVTKEGRGQSVESLAKTINGNRLFMVLLSPSYGAELGCVCAGVSHEPA
jgi:hypothetical protein